MLEILGESPVYKQNKQFQHILANNGKIKQSKEKVGAGPESSGAGSEAHNTHISASFSSFSSTSSSNSSSLGSVVKKEASFSVVNKEASSSVVDGYMHVEASFVESILHNKGPIFSTFEFRMAKNNFLTQHLVPGFRYVQSIT